MFHFSVSYFSWILILTVTVAARLCAHCLQEASPAWIFCILIWTDGSLHRYPCKQLRRKREKTLVNENALLGEFKQQNTAKTLKRGYLFIYFRSCPDVCMYVWMNGWMDKFIPTRDWGRYNLPRLGQLVRITHA